MPRLARPTALTMPCVTVCASPNGLPVASTISATSAGRSASVTTERPELESLTTARSVFASAPTSVPSSSRRSASVTRMSRAPSTTWLLVSRYPSRLTITPEPRLCSRRGRMWGSPKNRKNGSLKSGPRRDGVFDVAMFTTAGIAALATDVHPSGGTAGPGDAEGEPSLGLTRTGSRCWDATHHCARRMALALTRNAITATSAQNVICTDGRKTHTCQRLIASPSVEIAPAHHPRLHSIESLQQVDDDRRAREVHAEVAVQTDHASQPCRRRRRERAFVAGGRLHEPETDETLELRRADLGRHRQLRAGEIDLGVHDVGDTLAVATGR